MLRKDLKLFSLATRSILQEDELLDARYSLLRVSMAARKRYEDLVSE